MFELANSNMHTLPLPPLSPIGFRRSLESVDNTQTPATAESSLFDQCIGENELCSWAASVDGVAGGGAKCCGIPNVLCIEVRWPQSWWLGGTHVRS
jgi:hypothetical protein